MLAWTLVRQTDLLPFTSGSLARLPESVWSSTFIDCRARCHVRYRQYRYRNRTWCPWVTVHLERNVGFCPRGYIHLSKPLQQHCRELISKCLQLTKAPKHLIQYLTCCLFCLFLSFVFYVLVLLHNWQYITHCFSP